MARSLYFETSRSKVAQNEYGPRRRIMATEAVVLTHENTSCKFCFSIARAMN